MNDFRRNRNIPFAIPNEHGIWALWLSPFLLFTLLTIVVFRA